jgi:phage replication-related protein YjqB (UPF0714/DUF867 family)
LEAAASPALKREIKRNISAKVSSVSVKIDSEDPDLAKRLGGASTKNIVNRVARSGKGVHIEQSADARQNSAIAIASAVWDALKVIQAAR